MASLCFFIKKRNKKTVEETDNIHVHEHLKVKEAIIAGRHGPKAAVISMEDDVHIDEEIRKKEKFGGKGLHAKQAEGITSALEAGASSTLGSDQHHVLEHKP